VNWTKIKGLAHHNRLRFGLTILVILITAIVFIRFFSSHGEYLDSLRHIKLWVIVAIVLLNAGALLTLVFICNFMLELCGKRLPVKEQFLLTAYSSIVNFFGPLQSGPGVRAVYLKTRHKVRVRDYLSASLIYYAMFAMISALFLFGGSRPWWQTILVLLIVGLICYFIIRQFLRRGKAKPVVSSFHLSGKILSKLFFATFVQVCLITTYYLVELRAVSPLTSIRQAVVYSGAANFALFVSLTPDAVGFRETFLVLSKHLHHISTGTILSANLIDRAIYAGFLILLFILVLALHARNKLGLKKND
jgi:uncharacterized membrane protein YbhN (UPF0104 family)